MKSEHKQPQANPDWAPDDCPPDVVELIDIDNQLDALGLRGLGSADSKQVRTGWRRLTGQLHANYERGWRDGLRRGIVVGSLASAGIIGLVALVA